MPKTVSDQDLTNISTGSEGLDDLPGQVYGDNASGSEYMYVLNAGPTLAVVGNLAGQHENGLAGNATMSAATCLVDAVNSQGKMLGAWLSAVPAGQYGWVQKKGRTDALNGTLAAGEPLVPAGAGTPSFVIAAGAIGVPYFGYSLDGTTHLLDF